MPIGGVVFDEVVGEVQPDGPPAARAEPPPPPPPPDLTDLYRELRRLDRRAARLWAD